MSSASIALVDDHPIMLDALSRVLESESRYRVIARGETINALRIAQEHQPQLLIIGIQDAHAFIPRLSAIASNCPSVRCLAYAGTPTVDQAVRALEAGARGYAAKPGGVEEILQAVRLVLENEIYISPSFATGVIAALRNETLRKGALQRIRLSVRENQIIHLLLLGKSNREIAYQLAISEKTVKHYMTSLMQKLSVKNRTEAVLAAQRLIGPPQHGYDRVSRQS